VCLGVRVCLRVRSRRLFQIGRWNLVGAFHEGIETTAIDLVKVLLDEPVETTAVDLVKVLFHETVEPAAVDFVKVLLHEPVEPAAVDFIKVSLLATERYATENNIQHTVDHIHTIESTVQPPADYMESYSV